MVVKGYCPDAGGSFLLMAHEDPPVYEEDRSIRLAVGRDEATTIRMVPGRRSRCSAQEATVDIKLKMSKGLINRVSSYAESRNGACVGAAWSGGGE